MAATGVAGGYQRRRFGGVTFATGPTPPVPNPAVWFSADQITGVNDATAISAWPDLSGGGHNLAQATGANQPTYYKTTSAKLVNGKPAVWFNGTTTSMSAVVSLAQPFTVCLVAAPSATQQMYFSSGAAADPYLWISSGSLGTGAPTAITFGAITAALHSLVVAFNGASSYAKIDSAANVGGSPGTDGLTALTIGAYQGSADFLNGPVCEVLVYPRALSAAEATTVYSYFQLRWGTP